jgi:hypothetical protein
MSAHPSEKEIYEDYRQYLLLVGDIATHYATFEHLIDQTIWLLAGMQRRKGACVTSHLMGIQTKFRVIVALMHELKAPESLHNAANQLSKDAHKTSLFRNKYIHSPMSLAVVKGKLVPIRRHTGVDVTLKDELVPYDREEMLVTSARCQDLKNRATILKGDMEKHLEFLERCD